MRLGKRRRAMDMGDVPAPERAAVETPKMLMDLQEGQTGKEITINQNFHVVADSVTDTIHRIERLEMEVARLSQLMTGRVPR